MILESLMQIFAGGSGSGCHGGNCGRKSVSLYNNNPGHDKVYHINIQKQGDGHVVNVQWGRRGGSLKSGTKTPSPVSKEEAHRIMEALVSKKKNDRGYKEGFVN